MRISSGLRRRRVGPRSQFFDDVMVMADDEVAGRAASIIEEARRADPSARGCVEIVPEADKQREETAGKKRAKATTKARRKPRRNLFISGRPKPTATGHEDTLGGKGGPRRDDQRGPARAGGIHDFDRPATSTTSRATSCRPQLSRDRGQPAQARSGGRRRARLHHQSAPGVGAVGRQILDAA